MSGMMMAAAASAGVLTYRVSDWSLQPALVPHIQDNCYGIDYS